MRGIQARGRGIQASGARMRRGILLQRSPPQLRPKGRARRLRRVVRRIRGQLIRRCHKHRLHYRHALLPHFPNQRNSNAYIMRSMSSRLVNTYAIICFPVHRASIQLLLTNLKMAPC